MHVYKAIHIKNIDLMFPDRPIQGFQYFSSLPVLHYLQAVLFIKIANWTIFMNILYNTV
jgi:hypothetical protein